MNLEILAIGRVRAGPARDLFETYVERMHWPVTVRELDEKRQLAPVELKVMESKLLLGAIPSGAAVVVLDESGRSLSSRAFANKLGTWRDSGRGTVAFIIGGSSGLTDDVRHRADLLLSFGRQTWPHILARVMLIEQIYRAQQILAGHPYHRD